MGTIGSVIPPIHHEGYRFIAIFAVVSLILFWIWAPFGWLGVVLTIWCALFFRDPARFTPTKPGLVIAPADGLVQSVADAVPPPELDLGIDPLPRVSIFMNVFNVHVNRSPVSGSVAAISYTPGLFLNAALDKASIDNERNALKIIAEDGRAFGVVQIAGLVARRILCEVRVGQPLKTGERFGLIRFGSRVDVYFPAGVAPLVAVGQTMVAGETVLADLSAPEPLRLAEAR